MISRLLAAIVGVVFLTLLTACGSSKSVLKGDFTDFEGSLDGTTVELSFFSRSLEVQVVVGNGVVEEDRIEVDLSYDEDVPRWAFLSFTVPDDIDFENRAGRSVILERGAQYTLEIVDEPESFLRVESDGKYAHVFVQPVELDIEERELHQRLSTLLQQDAENRINSSLPPDEEDSSADTVREPSVHATVLDWDSMSCADYAGEYVRSWDSKFMQPNRIEPSEVVKEMENQLDEFYVRVYDQPFHAKLDSSTDPIERLLLVERGYALELDEAIQVYQQLASELPDHVVEGRVKPRLTNLQRRQARRQANEALKLGTIFPSIEMKLIDQTTAPLNSILEKNQVVVLDMWDNYCFSCLNGFEQYRSFYPDFVDRGFEVVSLSIEENRNDWIERSKELNFPWTNAHAPNGADGKVSKLLGIQFPRSNFVLDSDGCILKRNLTPDELLDFLGARFGS